MQLRILFTILILSLMGMMGCSTQVRRPIATSLQTLQLDSAPIKGPLLRHHEIFSIAGLLPMPEVGVFYHYPAKQRFPNRNHSMPPSTAIGVSDARTFRLTGTVGGDVEWDSVKKVLEAVNTVRDNADAVVTLELKRASLEVRIDQATQSGGRGTLPNPPVDVNSFRTQLNDTISQLTSAETNLKRSLATLRSETSVPGIVIAEWSVGESRQGEIDLQPMLNVAGSKTSKRTGLVILGGLRVSHLYPGDDMKDIFLNLQGEDRAAVGEAGLTTFLLQARHVRYVTDFNLADLLAAKVDVEAKALAQPELLLKKLDRVRLSTAYAAAAAMSSMGSLSGIAWNVEPVQIGQDLDKIQIANGWATVQAVVTTGDRLFKNWFARIPSGFEVKLEVIEHAADTDVAPFVDKSNEQLEMLRSTLQTDHSYLGKAQVIRHLSSLREAIRAINNLPRNERLTNMDKDDLNVIEGCARSVLGEIGNEETGWAWSAAKNRSKEMTVIVNKLHQATRAATRIYNRHSAGSSKNKSNKHDSSRN